MSSDERPLLIEPVVGWLREVEAGLVHYVSVDLRGPLNARNEEDSEAWPYEEEELAFSVSLDGAPYFVCEVLDDPGVVLHRFGGTYGPARFIVTAGAATGPATLRLTISNQWGTPVRKAELPCRIRESAGPGGASPRPVRGHVPVGPAAPAPAARRAGELPVGDWTEPDTTAGAPHRRTGLLRAFLERYTGLGRRTEERGARAQPSEPENPALAADASEKALPPDAEAVTISFAGFNQAWAAWIGDRLERRGVTVVQQRWDPPVEVPLEETLRDLTPARGRVLVILSDWYFQLGTRSHDEWNRALREVVAPDPDRFAAVTVTTSALPGATSALGAADLTDVGADEAERRLLARLGLPVDPLPEVDATAAGPRFPLDSPEVWGGVPRRNTRFTGREELLGSVHRALRGAGPGAGVVTLHGMSGVGKTQLAAEYVYRFGSEYDVVWWVPADRRAVLRRQLGQLAPELRLSTGPEYGERLRAVQHALRHGDPYSRWLLVLDGADEPDQVLDLVPTGPGHVLITSRNPEWRDQGSALVEVPVYTRAESLAFVRNRAPRLTFAGADRLADVLEDLPLLLDQTAGWLNDSDMSVDQYIELLERGTDQDAVKISADYPLAFWTGWSIQLNRLNETDPEAIDLLRLCTFFAPGSLPVRLLNGISMPGPLADEDRRDRALRRLLRHSAVRLETDPSPTAEGAGNGEALQIHRMVHQLVRGGIPDDVWAVYRDAARHALATADPGLPADTRLWPAYAALTPHLKWAGVLESTDPLVQQLVLNCLRYMYLSGEYGSGVRFAAPAMASWQALLGPAHPRIWDLRHHYANLLRATGDYRASERVERATADSLGAERGELDLEHLRAAGGLAADLRALGRYQEALELSVSIRDRDRQVLGQEDPRTLNAENNLAVSLRLLGRYSEALEQDIRTLELRRSVLPANASATMYSEINLAIDLRLLGRYREAGAALDATVRRHLRWMGGNNPQTLRAQLNLALCQHAQQGPTAALPSLTGTRERCLRLLGEHDPLTLLITASVACAERQAGEPRQALLLHELVVAGYRRMLGESHPYTIGVEGNLALMRWDLGDRQAASYEIERARTLMAEAVGANHPWTIGCSLNARLVRMRSGRATAARELARETGPRATAVLGPDHPLTVACRSADSAAGAGNRPFWDFEPMII
ncbi:FxSxx-COOH system tetratricopeptide repeat protein [Streptomyces sp. NPDC057460]|uniref:FxSxx-COOH system tetratricopeptide repeat protein n=1 Tax=Streptomyces sp. NPDC057460 TaxID=3346141 RepID=UPI00368F3E19